MSVSSPSGHFHAFRHPLVDIDRSFFPCRGRPYSRPPSRHPGSLFAKSNLFFYPFLIIIIGLFFFAPFFLLFFFGIFKNCDRLPSVKRFKNDNFLKRHRNPRFEGAGLEPKSGANVLLEVSRVAPPPPYYKKGGGA